MFYIATLTGPIIASLGSEFAGVFSNNYILSNQLFESGQDKERDYYNKKAAKDRQHATNAMQEKIQTTIQTALAAVQAHNSSVQALVQSENQKVLQMQKSAQSMAAKVKQQMKQRQQNQNQSAVA